MYQYDIRDITDHIYKNCRLERLWVNWLAGFYPEEERRKTGLVRFSFTFCCRHPVPNPDFGRQDGEDIMLLDLTAVQCENGADVNVVTTAGTFSFHCDYFIADLETYTGKSYRNIYPELNVPDISEDWFGNESEMQIADDLTIIRRYYCDKRFDEKGRLTAAHSYAKCRLLKNGTEMLAWVNGDCQVTLRNPVIAHSSGRRFVAYQVGLYGLCFVEPDSGEVYNYVPEGYSHDYRRLYGESFIITDIHYDSASDLCAFGGCYWAGPDEVFVGDLSDPLHYDPHFLRLADFVEECMGSEYDCDDIEFERWTDAALVINVNHQEYTISKEELFTRLRHEREVSQNGYSESNS